MCLLSNFRADYWKSNDRKFCDFCKCWIADNKPSISFHENGRRHKASVAKRISEISRNSAKSEKDKQKMDQEIRKMEEAAMKSYALDINAKADLTARNISTVIEAGVTNKPGVQIDPLLPPGDFSDDEDFGPRKNLIKSAESEPTEGSMWVEAKTREEYTYYWNVKTNASVWEPPKEGYMPIDEYNRINQIAIAQQELQLQKESKSFQETAAEAVARYNREKLKYFRKPDLDEKEKAAKRATYKTEEEAQAPQIGEWQPVVHKEEEYVDLQLPKHDIFIPQVVSEVPPEPPVKKFKEKTIESLGSYLAAGATSTFKKRKIASRGNTRQRLDVD